MMTVQMIAHGDVTLFVGADTVRVLYRDSQREVISWKFSMIRRYGVDRRMFVLESGRYR